MFRKLAILATFASAAMVLTAPAHATAYFIAGQWYYFSLDFEALIAKITGKDLKLGTYVGASVTILSADTECANPQSKLVNPGQGPAGQTITGISPNLTSDDLTKSDNKVYGNTYTTTATVLDLVDPSLRLNPPQDLCKNPPGAASWVPLFWQDRNCSKGLPPEQLTDPVCYKEVAIFVYNSDGTRTLTYATGALSGTPVAAGSDCSPDNPYCDWTFVYLPTGFKFTATLQNSTTGAYSYLYGQCQFPANNETGANDPGAPYSISNPPVNGWAAAPPVYYDCAAIPPY